MHNRVVESLLAIATLFLREHHLWAPLPCWDHDGVKLAANTGAGVALANLRLQGQEPLGSVVLCQTVSNYRVLDNRFHKICQLISIGHVVSGEVAISEAVPASH